MKNLQLNIFKRIYYNLIGVKYIYRDLSGEVYFPCYGTEKNKNAIYNNIFIIKPKMKYIFKIYVKDNKTFKVDLEKQKTKEKFKY